MTARLRFAGCLALGFLGMLPIALHPWYADLLPAPLSGWAADHVPGRADKLARNLVSGLALVGTVLLLGAWLRLRRLGVRLGGLLAAAAVWGLPLMLTVPVYTADPWAYAAQGWLVLTGQDPYAVPMGTPSPFAEAIYPKWRGTTAVYPPLALRVQELAVWLGGASPYGTLLALRILGLVGVVVTAYFLVRLAGRVGGDPTTTAWFTLCNPLVLTQFVGGIHLDSLMTAAVAAALCAASTRGGIRRVVALGLVGLATALKQPGAIAGVGATLQGTPVVAGARVWRARALRLALGGVLAVAVFVGLSLASGLGFGWLNSSGGSPSQVISHSPFSWLAQAALAHGTPAALVGRVVTITSGLAMVGVTAALVRRGAADRPVRFTGQLLLVFGLLGSALQPWYYLWGAPIVVATLARDRVRPLVAGSLMFTMSALLQRWPNPVIGTVLAAFAAYAWWRWTGDDGDALEQKGCA